MNHTPLIHHGGLGIFDKDGNLYASVSRYHEANRDEIIRACNSHDALVAACRAALHELIDIDNSRTVGSPPVSIAVIEQLALALAAAGEEGLDVKYEAMIADVGLHGENAEPQAMSDPLPLLDGSIRGET